MDLSLIIARLKSQLSGLKSIGGSADLDSAIAGQVFPPAAFVLPLTESASQNEMLGSTEQRITQTFSVVHVINNRRDAVGAAALDDLVALRTALRVALVGWVPDSTNGEPVTYTGGRLLRLDGDGQLWWSDEFQLITDYWSA
jgi:hypothetical protein